MLRRTIRRPSRPSDGRSRLTTPISFMRRSRRDSWSCWLVSRSQIGFPSRRGAAMPSASFKDELLAEIKNLRAFAISLSGSVSLADDLVQEALLRAWSKSERFQPGTSLRVWLFTLLSKLDYSYYRTP